MPVETGCVMWHGMGGANTSVAVPIYAGSSRVPKEYEDAPYIEDSTSAWWQFERLQKKFYSRWWEYSDAYFDVRKKLNRFQESVFKESERLEEKARELLKQGLNEEVNRLLSGFTYKKLEQALSEAKNLSLSRIALT